MTDVEAEEIGLIKDLDMVVRPWFQGVRAREASWETDCPHDRPLGSVERKESLPSAYHELSWRATGQVIIALPLFGGEVRGDRVEPGQSRSGTTSLQRHHNIQLHHGSPNRPAQIGVPPLLALMIVSERRKRGERALPAVEAPARCTDHISAASGNADFQYDQIQ